MMKRILALLFCAVLAVSLFACGTPDASTDGTDSDASASSGDTENKGPALYDETMEHKFLVTDIKNGAIAVLDLNKCDGDWTKLTGDQCVVWEWVSSKCSTCKYPNKVQAGIDDAKLRYSPYYKEDVIIACSSSGWAGIISYKTKEVLFEVLPSNGPHSIELLPNGDFVVACSGGSNWSTKGYLCYYPISAGVNSRSSELKVPSAHGVQWDPQRNLLWVLQYDGVISVTVEKYGTKNATLKKGGFSAYFGDGDASGHDLSPVYGQPGKYWVTAGNVWSFDSERCTLNSSYKNQGKYNAKNVKGIAYFADGTMILTPTGAGTGKSTYDWSTHTLQIVHIAMSEGRVKQPIGKVTRVTFTDREFYKVHTFSKDYQ